MDMQATTPMDPRVLDAMLPYLTHDFGNPHSRTHQYGNDAEKAVEIAREHIAALIGATHKDIVFTSGATESNNLAIKGAAHYQRKNNQLKETYEKGRGSGETQFPHKKHIITTLTEHKCVLDSFRALQQWLVKISLINVYHLKVSQSQHLLQTS